MVTIVPGTIVTSWTRVLRHATVATLTPDGAPYGLVADGAVALAGDRIAWVGASRDPPTLPDSTQVDALAGALVTPGLVDCHTHLVWAGNRHREFEQRLLGASYADIARAGGGILSSVRATRAASEDELLAAALPRARALLAEGVTCIEVKSGYGLDVDTELRQLRVARRLAASLPLTVRTTMLAAHAVPPEFAGRADDYVDHVCDVILPAAAAAGLADAVDAFCEDIGFSAAQVERLFHRAAALGLPVKLHAEQLSADHLEWLDEPGARSLAAAGSVAVLLPAAFYWLRETRAPPVDVLRRERVPMAVATDLNPGSAPVASLLLAMNMACVLFRLTAEEALAGVTREAARALGLAAERGTLEAGKAADLVAWDAGHPSELVSQVGLARPRVILRAGVDVAG